MATVEEHGRTKQLENTHPGWAGMHSEGQKPSEQVSHFQTTALSHISWLHWGQWRARCSVALLEMPLGLLTLFQFPLLFHFVSDQLKGLIPSLLVWARGMTSHRNYGSLCVMWDFISCVSQTLVSDWFYTKDWCLPPSAFWQLNYDLFSTLF